MHKDGKGTGLRKTMNAKASHLNTLRRLNPKLSINKSKPRPCARHETMSRVTRGACCCCQPGELSTQACFTGRNIYSSALAKKGESREKGMGNNLESGCLYGGLTPVVCTTGLEWCLGRISVCHSLYCKQYRIW